MKSAEVELKEIRHKCTNCGTEDEIEVEVRRKGKEKQVIEDDSDLMQKLQSIDQDIKQLKKQKDDEAEKPKKPEGLRLPRYIPRHVCKGANCEGHDNEEYTERPNKRCTNCNGALIPDSVAKCPMCGNKDPDNFEIIDEEDLDAIGIPRPAAAGHDHVH